MTCQFYEYFYDAFYGDNKYSVITARRREGKTLHCVLYLFHQLLQNPKSRALWVDTVQANLGKYYDRYWASYLKEYVQNGTLSYNRQSHIMEFKNGSTIDFASAERPENLEGFAYDYIICNEAGIIFKKEALWDNTIAPMAKNAKKVILAGCVTGSTKVMARNGIEPIIVNDKGSLVKELQPIQKEFLGINKSWNYADGFWNNGIVDTVRITTLKGFQIECSKIHPLLDGSGTWIRSGDISLGTQLMIDNGMECWGNGQFREAFIVKTKSASNRSHHISTPTAMTNDLAYLIGLYLAEGSCDKSGNRLTITCGDDVTKDIQGFGFFRCRHDQWRINSRALIDIFKNLGVPLVRSKNRTLPECVWSMTREQSQHFLSGYFDGDGHSRKNRRCIVFTSANEQLMRDIQVLCSNFGALGKITSVVSKPTKKVSVSSLGHRLEFNGLDFELVADFIKPRVKRKLDKIILVRERSKKKPCNRRLVGEYFKDTVVSIDYGTAHTYDFTIPNTNSFWSNGFISHNTPKGNNKFYELSKRENISSEWKTFKINPEKSFEWTKEELEQIKLEVPDMVYRQEYCGEFVSSGAGVFKIIKTINTLSSVPTISIGIDLGRHNDETVIHGISRDCSTTFLESWDNLSFEVQKPRIIDIWVKLGYPKVYLDMTGLGLSVYDSLKIVMGNQIEGINFSSTTKRDLIQNAQILIEQGKYIPYNDKKLLDQLSAYEYQATRSGGVTYNAPDGEHDDYVIATALALLEFRPLKVREKIFINLN